MTSTTTDRLAGVNAGLSSKAPVLVATTASVTLSGEQTIDGVAVVADDRILVKDQTDGIENGIYDCKSGSWVRSLDFDGTGDVKSGTFVVVASGTAGTGLIYRLSTADDITLGTTSIAFALMTLESASAFMITVLGDANSAAARATLEAAGTEVVNSFNAVQTFVNTAIFTKGADIASAPPLVLGADGNYFDVTGTEGFSQITCTAGTLFMLQFDGALTMTDGASLDLGGANITTAAGDRFLFFAVAANTAQLVAVYYEGDQRRVDSTGAVTNAVQPCFRATNATLTNVTGNATDYTIVFATEVFDQNVDFDGTSTFTAPITGKYLLTASVIFAGLTEGVADLFELRLTTSNDTYGTKLSATNIPSATDWASLAIIADMDASDTATVVLDIAGEASAVADIAAGGAHFSGVLIA